MTEKKCQKKCKLDQQRLTCIGCGRTLKEITDAGNAAARQRQENREASGEDEQEGEAEGSTLSLNGREADSS